MNENLLKFKKNLSGSYTKIERINGLFTRGYLNIVASSAGVGKTWFSLYLSCSWSVGKDIFTGAKNSPLKILFMAGETGSNLLNKRISATDWQYNPENIVIFDSYDFAMNNTPYLLNTPEGRRTTSEIVTNIRPDVLFFDTLISYHSLDESKQAEMTQIYLYLCKLARLFDCTVICNHHTRKRPADNPNRKQNQDDVIGTSAGVRLASDVYLLSKTDDNESIIIKHAKSWDKKNPEMYYKLITNYEGKTDLKFSTNNEEYTLRYQIEELIRNLDVFDALEISVTAMKLNANPKLVGKILQELYQEKKVSRLKAGNKFIYGKIY